MEINSATTLLLELVRLSNRLQRHKDLQVNQPFEQLSGLSIKAFHTLHLIQQGAQNPSELVRELGVPPSTATRLLDNLVHTDLIARTPNPEDLRQMLLSLTPTGQQRYESAWEIYLNCLQTGLAKLPTAALEQAVTALHSLEHSWQTSHE